MTMGNQYPPQGLIANGLVIGVAGTIVGGTGVFGGQGSYTTITFAVAMANTNYKVHIMAVADPGYVGDIWIDNKTINAFRVNNTGVGVSAFEWSAEVF